MECDNILIEKELLQKATETAREKAKELIESVGTEALQMVLGEDKRIVIRLTQRDGVPAANLFVQTIFGENDVLENNPNYGGGGVRDIISLSTLTANRMLEAKNNKAPMFLDEPFKNVSSDYAEKIAEFLNKLVEYFGGQFFVVTHERNFMPNTASKTFSVTLNSDKVSNVEAI